MKNVKRRDFLKMASALSAGRVLPVSFGLGALAQQAHADGPDYSSVNVETPDVMPQVINVFLYGGASELAGNLSNIVDIDENSVNRYSSSDAFGSGIIETASQNPTGFQITENGCWKDAGGTHMEDMLTDGHMALYRTVFKQKRPTRSHRESIFMSHKGTLDIENSPGIGSRIAHTMMENRAKYEGATLADNRTINNLDEMILPFVSFEGETQTYALDPNETLPLYFRGLTMDQNFDNPYSRSSGSDSLGGLDALVNSAIDGQLSSESRYKKAAEGFKKREELDARMDKLKELSNLTDTPLPMGVTYPDNDFADQLRSVVTLAIHNPETMYMAVGTPGLGGWDNHNNGVDSYPGRMDQLMSALKSAMAHIEASAGAETIGGGNRVHTNNIVINVFGDFGRLVNLNDSKGWDHANNQNLYTFGGAGVRPPKEAAAMGKIVGKTQRQGTSKTNNQYTVPTADSVTFEPMCIASSIYGYFGVQNPHVLTASEGNESGDGRLEDGLPEIGTPLS